MAGSNRNFENESKREGLEYISTRSQLRQGR